VTIEVAVPGGWRPLTLIPKVPEDRPIEFRGVPDDLPLAIAGVAVTCNGGRGSLRLHDEPDLRCHVGLLPVELDGQPIGELEIEPGKLTEAAWDRLRADLQAVWTGLLYDDRAVAALRATFRTWPPDPNELWKDIAPVVIDLESRPVETLAITERWVRQERARTARELRPSLVVAGARGRPGRARSLGPVVSEPERALVRDCLARLHALASRDPDAATTADSINRFLRSGTFSRPAAASPTVTHLARHEPRLRRIVDLRQRLLNPLGVITEGPGELRLGIKSLDRIYEYWVFLTVLQSLRQEFGEPLGPGFEQLCVRLPGERVRLVLPEGTTVEFPGGIRAAFTPTITQNGLGSWADLELAALPAVLGRPHRGKATPDTLVLKEFADGSTTAVVIDAKYRARARVDAALWEIHEKYARIRHNGIGIVSTVIAAHPNQGLHLQWAGQRAVPFVPAEPPPQRLWPADWHEPTSDTDRRYASGPWHPAAEGNPEMTEPSSAATRRRTDQTAVPRPAPIPAAVPNAVIPRTRILQGSWPETPADLVLCDQSWTAAALGPERIDLAELRRKLTTPTGTALMVGSHAGNRERFATAARFRQWRTIAAETRQEALDAMEGAVREAAIDRVIVIGDFSDLQRRLATIETLTELYVINDLAQFM